MKILVADDYARSRSQLARILEGDGHKVLKARDGGQALEIVKEEEPDIAFIDWEMPVMSGQEVCRAVRDFEETTVHSTYLILMTARSRKRDLLDGLESGANDFVLKPHLKDAVISRIHVAEQHMASRPREDKAPEARETDTEPVAVLKEEHRVIRRMVGILEMVASLLDEGVPVPRKLADWSATSIFLLNWELHETKEYAYISAFIDRANTVHGKTSQIFLRSSLTQVMREHEIIKKLLFDIQRATYSYDIDRVASVRQLKADINKFLPFIRQHASREEDVFFPLSQLYLTGSDIAAVMEAFGRVDEGIGAGKLESRLENLARLEEILRFRDKT